MNYKGILIDLDNTLYDYDQAHLSALDRAMNWFSNRFGLARLDSYALYERAKHLNHVQLRMTASSHSRLLYFQKMMELIGAFDIKDCLTLDKLYWDAYLDAMVIEPDVVTFFKSIHVPKCIVTDFTAEAQYEKLIQLGIEDWVDHLVTSEEAGVEKPHPFIFKLALQKLGLKADEVVMIGDSYKKDCLGAADLGIDSVLYKGDADKADTRKGIVVLNSFHDIMHWLE